ncbi:unnamed protein product [Malus baccata var. baccata]
MPMLFFLLIVLMASLLFLSLLPCKATRFPDACQTSLTNLVTEPNTTPLQTIQFAVQLSGDGVKTAQGMVKTILDSSPASQNRTTAANNCLDILANSQYRISLATDSLSRGKIKNARASMSSALLYQYGCWSGLKNANDTSMVDETMSFLDSLIGKSSNALGMMASYDNFGNDTKMWAPPKTERDGFWERLEHGGPDPGFRGGVPSGSTANVTEAVNAAPDNAGNKRFVIGIKGGVYEETVRVALEKRNVMLLGDGIGKTIITGSLNVGQPGISTYNTATVGVLGDGFMASGLTIQNTAGPDARQAVAFRSDSDLSVIENCEFIGNQDTLYAQGNRQFYKSCTIHGNVDFIFGKSASIFQDCTILVPHRRTDPALATGFVFRNCSINGPEEYMRLYRSKPQVHKNYLGRPWKEYSRTVFINCSMEALITPQGWMPWSGDFALTTLYFGEFGNFGAGCDLSQRWNWTSKIPSQHVNTYSVQNFIQGDEWMST